MKILNQYKALKFRGKGAGSAAVLGASLCFPLVIFPTASIVIYLLRKLDNK
jgi:hypothetical protein